MDGEGDGDGEDHPTYTTAFLRDNPIQSHIVYLLFLLNFYLLLLLKSTTTHQCPLSTLCPPPPPGEIFLPLKELADGFPIMDIFPLKSDDGRPAGSLQISMRWKHPFRRSRELGPRSLSATEVESLISTFSAGEMHEGLVGYKDFCRFVDPPRDVLRTMERLRTYSQKMYEKENLKSRELFRVLLDLKSEEETFKEEAFTQVRSSPLLLSPISLSCSSPLILFRTPLP